MYQLVGEGTELSQMGGCEGFFQEGETGHICVYLTDAVPQDIGAIERQLLSQGVWLTQPVKQAGDMITIGFEKRIAPLVIVAIVVSALGLVGAGLAGWQIWKSVQVGVPLWCWLVGGGALVYLILAPAAKKAAPMVIERYYPRVLK